MNSRFLGDSYDLVKRVILNEFFALGYRIIIDPMYTGVWTQGEKRQYSTLIKPGPFGARRKLIAKSILFLDPDTGVNRKDGKRHVSFSRLAKEANRYSIVICFDQSFSFARQAQVLMQSKLESLSELGCYGMYYNSHARFLFVTKNGGALKFLSKRLMSIGLPANRLVTCGT